MKCNFDKETSSKTYDTIVFGVHIYDIGMSNAIFNIYAPF